MKAIIIDDERLARDELRDLLRAHPEIEVIGEAAHNNEARALIHQKRPDIIFLDIQMPGADGFTLLET
ncbi:MAG: response regulator, partial [Opitutaceae bacterium]|nr:response regulator [Opitutaceae bacterium]